MLVRIKIFSYFSKVLALASHLSLYPLEVDVAQYCGSLPRTKPVVLIVFETTKKVSWQFGLFRAFWVGFCGGGKRRNSLDSMLSLYPVKDLFALNLPAICVVVYARGTLQAHNEKGPVKKYL